MKITVKNFFLILIIGFGIFLITKNDSVVLKNQGKVSMYKADISDIFSKLMTSVNSKMSVPNIDPHYYLCSSQKYESICLENDDCFWEKTGLCKVDPSIANPSNLKTPTNMSQSDYNDIQKKCGKITLPFECNTTINCEFEVGICSYAPFDFNFECTSKINIAACYAGPDCTWVVTAKNQNKRCFDKRERDLLPIGIKPSSFCDQYNQETSCRCATKTTYLCSWNDTRLNSEEAYCDSLFELKENQRNRCSGLSKNECLEEVQTDSCNWDFYYPDFDTGCYAKNSEYDDACRRIVLKDICNLTNVCTWYEGGHCENK